jgi:hypothetical protein
LECMGQALALQGPELVSMVALLPESEGTHVITIWGFHGASLGTIYVNQVLNVKQRGHYSAKHHHESSEY